MRPLLALALAGLLLTAGCVGTAEPGPEATAVELAATAGNAATETPTDTRTRTMSSTQTTDPWQNAPVLTPTELHDASLHDQSWFFTIEEPMVVVVTIAELQDGEHGDLIWRHEDNHQSESRGFDEPGPHRIELDEPGTYGLRIVARSGNFSATVRLDAAD